MPSEEVEVVAKEIDRLALILAHDDFGASREDGIMVGYNPRRTERDHEGPLDPWWARWKGYHATGQTCEMALLELQAAILKIVDGVIEEERRRIALAEARIVGMQEMVAQRHGKDGT